MSCYVSCFKCGARKRFEAQVVWIFDGVDNRMVTRLIECPCGYTYRVQIPRPGTVP